MDRLTRLCAAATVAMENDPEYREGDKWIVLANDADRGGVTLHGYDDDTDAIVDLFIHLKGIFEANGKQLAIVPLGGDS